MLVKRIEKKNRVEQNAWFSVGIAVLFFLLQIFCYQFFYGMNNHVLYGLLEKFLNLPVLQHLINRLPVNDVKNMVFPFYLMANGLTTVAIIWLIYKNAYLNRLSIFFIVLGACLYVACNLLHKATGSVEMSVVSMDILNFFSSPLITLFLIPTFKLYRR